MNNTAASSHPLHRAGLQVALVALVVFVLHTAREHVSHSLEATVGVIREARDVIVSLILKIVWSIFVQ